MFDFLNEISLNSVTFGFIFLAVNHSSRLSTLTFKGYHGSFLIFCLIE